MLEKNYLEMDKEELLQVASQLQREIANLSDEIERNRQEHPELEQQMNGHSKEEGKGDYASLADRIVAESDMEKILKKMSDRYLKQLSFCEDKMKKLNAVELEKAQKEADQLIKNAQIESQDILIQLKVEIDSQWENFQKKMDDILGEHH